MNKHNTNITEKTKKIKNKRRSSPSLSIPLEGGPLPCSVCVRNGQHAHKYTHNRGTVFVLTLNPPYYTVGCFTRARAVRIRVNIFISMPIYKGIEINIIIIYNIYIPVCVYRAPHSYIYIWRGTLHCDVGLDITV